jgi:hypothetical protein
MEPDLKKAEFIKQWRDRLAGMALNGVVWPAEDKPSGFFSLGKYALELPKRVDTMLSQMYDHAARLHAEAQPPLGAAPMKGGTK